MNPDELLAAILESVGEASMCWSNIEGAGTFQDERAIEIAKRLANRIPLQRPPHGDITPVGTCASAASTPETV